MGKVIEIKNIDGDIIFSSDKFDTVKQAVKHCLSNGISLRLAYLKDLDLSGLDLSDANFRGANVSFADFSSAILIGANFRGANVSFADFSSANLSFANFTGAYLCNCKGNNKEIVTLKTEFYVCNFTKGFLNIGCRTHSYSEWFEFTDEVIYEMDLSALEFWNKYKEQLIELKSKYGF